MDMGQELFGRSGEFFKHIKKVKGLSNPLDYSE